MDEDIEMDTLKDLTEIVILKFYTTEMLYFQNINWNSLWVSDIQIVREPYHVEPKNAAMVNVKFDALGHKHP